MSSNVTTCIYTKQICEGDLFFYRSNTDHTITIHLLTPQSTVSLKHISGIPLRTLSELSEHAFAKAMDSYQITQCLPNEGKIQFQALFAPQKQAVSMHCAMPLDPTLSGVDREGCCTQAEEEAQEFCNPIGDVFLEDVTEYEAERASLVCQSFHEAIQQLLDDLRKGIINSSEYNARVQDLVPNHLGNTCPSWNCMD